MMNSIDWDFLFIKRYCGSPPDHPPPPFLFFCLKTCDSYVSWCARWHTLAHAFAWISDSLCVMKADLMKYKAFWSDVECISASFSVMCTLLGHWQRCMSMSCCCGIREEPSGTVFTHDSHKSIPPRATCKYCQRVPGGLEGARGFSRVFFQVKIKFSLHHVASAITGQRCTMHIKTIKLKSPSSPWLGPNFPVGKAELIKNPSLKRHHLKPQSWIISLFELISSIKWVACTPLRRLLQFPINKCSQATFIN